MTIVTERAEIEARARVTRGCGRCGSTGASSTRSALPWHWGYAGAGPGDITNDLGGISGEPNVSIQESKAFTCDVRAGRRTQPSTRTDSPAAAPARRTVVAPTRTTRWPRTPRRSAE